MPQRDAGTQEPPPARRVVPASFPARENMPPGGYAMWISLFAVAAAIAIALSVGAVVMESYEEQMRPY